MGHQLSVAGIINVTEISELYLIDILTLGVVKCTENQSFIIRVCVHHHHYQFFKLMAPE